MEKSKIAEGLKVDLPHLKTLSKDVESQSFTVLVDSIKNAGHIDEDTRNKIIEILETNHTANKSLYESYLDVIKYLENN